MSDFTKQFRKRFGIGAPSWTPSASAVPDVSRHDPNSSDPFISINIFNITPGPSLGPNERGAVWPLYPAEAFPGPAEIIIDSFPVPFEDIRTALLFFDRFDIPSQRILGGITWCEREFDSVGVLSQSLCNVSGDAATLLRDLPFQTFEKRDETEPGRWTLSRPAQALGVPEGVLQPNTAAALTLQNALPSFARDVPLDAVMEFKRLRWDELLALRIHLDELCAQLRVNGSNDFAQSVAFRKFTASLKAHIDVMNESNRSKVWRSLKASFDASAAFGAGGEAILTGSIDLGSLGAGAIVIGWKTVAGLAIKRDATNPFEYLTSAHLEL